MEKFKIPIHVTKSFLPPIEEYNEMIKQIWESNWVTNNGPIHNQLEKEVEKYLKVENGTLFVNGHIALEMAIKALDLKGEVITTPFTFASTTHAITRNNLKPVFCDINMSDFTIDVNAIENLITENTSAIIPTHVFGYPCNVKKINDIAKRNNLKVIYDAAHVFGVEINGIGIGNFGDCSMFSLHATKVFNTIEGGLVTYSDNTLKNKLMNLKNFGITGPESVEEIGGNGKMNEFQAAMGMVNLKYLDQQILKRKKIAEEYRKNLKMIKGIRFLSDIEDVRHNYSYFPIIVENTINGIDRDQLVLELNKWNIFPRKYFYPLVTEFKCYKEQFRDVNIPNAKYISEKVITLPIYGDLGIEDVKIICQIIKNTTNLR